MIAIPGTEVPGYFHGVPLGRENGINGSTGSVLHPVTFPPRMTRNVNSERPWRSVESALSSSVLLCVSAPSC
jgi:hypothetical protein